MSPCRRTLPGVSSGRDGKCDAPFGRRSQALLRQLQQGRPRLMLSTAFETGIGFRWLALLSRLQWQGPTPAAPGLAPGWCPEGPCSVRSLIRSGRPLEERVDARLGGLVLRSRCSGAHGHRVLELLQRRCWVRLVGPQEGRFKGRSNFPRFSSSRRCGLRDPVWCCRPVAAAAVAQSASARQSRPLS